MIYIYKNFYKYKSFPERKAKNNTTDGIRGKKIKWINPGPRITNQVIGNLKQKKGENARKRTSNKIKRSKYSKNREFQS